MGTEALWVPLVTAAISGAITYENGRRTERKQDNQLADSIRKQSAKQRQADAKVSDEVATLEQSTAADERKQRLNDYMTTIQQAKGKITQGLTPTIGSDTFKADSAKAATDVQQGAANDAGLYARIDAPGMQRMGEGFGYGNLATDLGLIGRESQGQSFLDELRLRAIRRNPWLDMAASAIGSYGGGAGATTGSTAGAAAGSRGSGSGYSRYGTGPA